MLWMLLLVIMNQQDRKEFDIIHLKIDGMKDITELRKEMDVL